MVFEQEWYNLGESACKNLSLTVHLHFTFIDFTLFFEQALVTELAINRATVVVQISAALWKVKDSHY